MDLEKYKGLFVTEAKEYLQQMSGHIVRLQQEVSTQVYDELFRAAHSIKGMSASMGYSGIKEICHNFETLFDEFRNGTIQINDVLISHLLKGIDLLETLLDEVNSGNSIESFSEDITRYLQILERLDSAVKEGNLAMLEQTDSMTPTDQRTVSRASSVRVDGPALDRLIESVGELVILNAVLQESFSRNAQVSRLHVLAGKLYNEAMDLRMFPLEEVCSGFPRLIYDLGQKLGKQVRFAMEGAGIRLDKAIIDELLDPLVHLLRNAVDHGIETAEERKRLGKMEEGSICLSIARQGERVRISVEDDGAGIDMQRVKQVAIEKGFWNPKSGHALNRQECLILITRPGFSTRSQVSDVSGRGVGLDVVRAKIEGLGGTLTIDSEPGIFTRFEILVPSTVAVLSVLLVRCADQSYALPMARIERMLMIQKGDIFYTETGAVLPYGNGIAHIEHLASALAGEDAFEFPEELPAIITEHQNRKIAWCVDELLEEKKVLLKSLGEPLSLLNHFSGATVLGKGEVIPMVDLEYLYREKYQQG